MTITTDGAANASRAGSGAGPAVAGNGEVSQLFTTLLVAQIRNQNPLEPTDPSAFVSQLTQLSQMEALQTLTKQGSANAAMLESLQVLALGGQIGSQVTAVSEHVVIDNEPVQGHFRLANGAAEVSLVIESASGQQQRIPFGTRPAGEVPFTLDPAALGLTPGTYSIRVEAGGGTAAPPVEVLGTLRGVKLSPAEGVVLDVSHLGYIGSGSVTGFSGKPGPAN